jgi:hypothetical protein
MSLLGKKEQSQNIWEWEEEEIVWEGVGEESQGVNEVTELGLNSVAMLSTCLTSSGSPNLSKMEEDDEGGRPSVQGRGGETNDKIKLG